jgi:hypothetical protein
MQMPAMQMPAMRRPAGDASGHKVDVPGELCVPSTGNISPARIEGTSARNCAATIASSRSSLCATPWSCTTSFRSRSL